MATFRDPTVNPPLLPRPGALTPPYRSSSVSPIVSPISPSSQSPAPSPTRLRLHTISQDPILRDLSPTKTLRALSICSHTPTENDLMKSVEHVTDEDRAFGVRVAQTCKDLREWAVEVEAWEWPGTFEPPPVADRASNRRRLLAEHQVPHSHLSDNTDDEDEGFWGSLPREIVLSHEARIDAIQQAMEEMDVEGLKNHVRNVHILPKSNSPQQDEFVSFRVRSVDDYTTLITATILQALPYLSWLSRLMHEWSIRLVVLRKVPGYLSGMSETQKQLHAAWSDLSLDKEHSRESANPIRDKFESMRTVLGSKVSALGQRLDSMLDEIEGRSEILPDSWIDRFETLELAYSHWVVRAERTLTGLAWEFDLPSTAAATPGYDALGITSESRSPYSLKGAQAEDVQIDRVTLDSSNGEDRVESPTLGERPWPSMSPSSNSGHPVRSRQESAIVRLVDDVILESQEQAVSPIVNEGTGRDTLEAASRNLIPSPVPQKGHPIVSPAKSPRNRARHIPIDVEAYKAAAIKAGMTLEEKKEELYSCNREPPLPAPTEAEQQQISASTIAARRALFNGDLESKQSLLKASSPVRPFEHASTAFTKLFKAANRDPSRTQSAASKNPLKKKNSPSLDVGRRSFSGSRPSTLSLDVPSATESRVKNTSDGMNAHSRGTSRSSARHLQPPTSNPASDRLAQSTQHDHDWSDKEVVVAGNLSDNSPVVSFGKFDSPMTQGVGTSSNWPLPAAAVDEISSPDGVIGTDTFEQMFVDTLPISPDLDDSYNANLATFDDYIDKLRHGTIMREPVQVAEEEDEALVDGVYNQTIQDLKGQHPRKKHNANREKSLKNDEKASLHGYETSSVLRSQTSTPEVHDAASANVVRPHEVSTPRAHRIKKKRSRKDKYEVMPAESGMQQAATSSRARLYIDGDNDADRSGSDKEAIRTPRSLSKQVALAALEADVRQEEHAIAGSSAQESPIDLIQGRPSLDSNYSYSLYHDAPDTKSTQPAGRDRSDTTQSEPLFPLPPTSQTSHLRTFSAKDGKSMLHALRSDSERSIVAHRLGAAKPRPLAFSGKCFEIIHEPDVNGNSESNVSVAEARPETPQRSEKRRDSTSASSGDYMDRHVSQVLRKMTSNIHFSTHAGSSTPRAATPSQQSGRISSQRRSSRGITLAPASPPEASLKQHVRNGETKLYHLSQPGKEQPIKLFVRLVGEDERVMVRVGGGWMDLEDYLRQYAEHHTRCTISSGEVQVTEASRVTSDRKSYSSRPGSRLGLTNDSVRSPDMNSSPRSVRAGNHSTDDVTLKGLEDRLLSDTLASPSSQSSMYFDPAPSPSARSVSTERANRDSQLRANPLFPKILDHSVRSRPSSVGGITPSSPLSAATSPDVNNSATKTGLDAQKARWVEDMMARAKQSAGEKKRTDSVDSKKEWQDLGRVGATTRRLGSHTSITSGGPTSAGGFSTRKGEGRFANKW